MSDPMGSEMWYHCQKNKKKCDVGNSFLLKFFLAAPVCEFGMCQLASRRRMRWLEVGGTCNVVHVVCGNTCSTCVYMYTHMCVHVAY